MGRWSLALAALLIANEAVDGFLYPSRHYSGFYGVKNNYNTVPPQMVQSYMDFLSSNDPGDRPQYNKPTPPTTPAPVAKTAAQSTPEQPVMSASYAPPATTSTTTSFNGGPEVLDEIDDAEPPAFGFPTNQSEGFSPKYGETTVKKAPLTYGYVEGESNTEENVSEKETVVNGNASTETPKAEAASNPYEAFRSFDSMELGDMDLEFRYIDEIGDDNFDTQEEAVLDEDEDEDEDEDKPEPSLEEQIASALSNTADIAFGQSSQGVYRNVRETLRDSKARSQRRISRSTYEKEKARDKIAKLETRLAEEKKRLEDELNYKITETQNKIDEEVLSISISLRSILDMKKDRHAEILVLISNLLSSVSTKEAEIDAEELITREMVTVRKKVKQGTIASQLDSVIEQKQKVTAIERAIVSDLNECVQELQVILEESKGRAKILEETVNRFVSPDVRTDVPYEWSDIEEMESVLEGAAEDVTVYEKKVVAIRDRINEALLKKTLVLGETVPGSLAKLAEKKRIKQEARIRQDEFEKELEDEVAIISLRDLQNVPDEQVKKMLSESACIATKAGGRTILFGLKSILDTLTGEQVAQAASSAIVKTEAIGKGFGGISSAARKPLPTERSAAIQRITDFIYGDEIQDTLKTAGEAFGAFGEAGRVFAESMGTYDSTKQSNKAARETGKSVVNALNAATALGSRQVGLLKDKVDKEEKSD